MLTVIVKIWLCGEFRVEVDGERVERRLTRRKSRELLALLSATGGGLSRERLIEDLWPEEAPGSRDGALRQLLCELRHCLSGALVVDGCFVRLDLPDEECVDTRAAESALSRCFEATAAARWREARELARTASTSLIAEFMPGFTSRWIEQRRVELEDIRTCALEALAEVCLGGHDARAAELAAKQVIWRAPYREHGYLLLMQALIAKGNSAEALRVYERLRTLLREQLGTTPGPTLREVHALALQGGDEPTVAMFAG